MLNYSSVILLILVALGGCQKQEVSSPGSTPVSIGEYVTERSAWRWLQNGSVFCYDKRPDDTCILVEYPSGVGVEEGLISRFEYGTGNSGVSAKVVSMQKLTLKPGKGICSISTAEFYDSIKIYRAADDRAWVGQADELMQHDNTRKFVEDLKRAAQQTFGRETCFRFQVTKVSTDGLVMEMQEHAFIDGIRQSRTRDSLITFFSQQQAKDGLRLRPGEP